MATTPVDPSSEAYPAGRPRARFPAISVAIAFSLGIAADYWTNAPLVWWATAAIIMWLAWVACFLWKTDRPAVWFLLAACAAIGGARHHSVWSVARYDDISRHITVEPRPVRLRGRVVSTPTVRSKQERSNIPSWARLDSTECLLECNQLWSDDVWAPVSGTAQLLVLGHLFHVLPGDQVEVHGRMQAPHPPMNPGQFDYSAYLRRQGIRAIVRTEDPATVLILEQQTIPHAQRLRGRIRESCRSVLVRYLSPRTAAVAAALLLGDRSDLPDDVRTVFVESGTMHVLAISGLHVGIFAMIPWLLCRLMRLSPMTTSLVLIGSVASYAFLTGLQPPVLRAAILTGVVAAGLPLYLRAPAANTLAIAALVVLVRNPTDLFDTGAQLSFLAVAVIVGCGIWRACRKQDRVPDELDSGEELDTGLAWHIGRSVWTILSFYFVSTAIWLATTPLLLSTFHLVSPIGIAVNVVMIPLLAVVLWLGFGLLLCGLLLPEAAQIVAACFQGSLSLLIDLVDGAALDAGHFYTAASSQWWLAGFYWLLGCVLFSLITVRRTQWLVRGLATWTLFGLAIAFWPQHAVGLRTTFLSLGHGCSILVELPNGKTLLYDAGRLDSGDAAQQIIQTTLWNRGHSRIDALLLSHADSDHFNAVPGLVRTIPIGCVMGSKSFFESPQPEIGQLVELLFEEDIPIRIIGRGDRLLMDPSVTLRVLYPNRGTTNPDDNANSVVLSIEYAGRRILLTGDLENEGLDSLLSQPPVLADVLLSPHHGSQRANSADLAQWANPKWVVISAGRPGVPERLRGIYGSESEVLSTREHGAITFEISPSGEIRAERFLEPVNRLPR